MKKVNKEVSKKIAGGALRPIDKSKIPPKK